MTDGGWRGCKYGVMGHISQKELLALDSFAEIEDSSSLQVCPEYIAYYRRSRSRSK
jgi:hypothetical protein